MQRAVVDALEDVKARDIVVLNTERLSPYFERVVIASGDSTRQVKALADNVQKQLKRLGAKVAGLEGMDTAEWVLVDLGDVVVHVMHPTTRLYYNLEEIWGGKAVHLKSAAPAPRVAARPKASPAKKRKTPAAPRTRKAVRAKPASPGRPRASAAGKPTRKRP